MSYSDKKNKIESETLGFTEWENKVSNCIIDAMSCLEPISCNDPVEFADLINDAFIALGKVSDAVLASRRMRQRENRTKQLGDK